MVASQLNPAPSKNKNSPVMKNTCWIFFLTINQCFRASFGVGLIHHVYIFLETQGIRPYCIQEYLRSTAVNKLLIRPPIFWRKHGIGRVPLDSHENMCCLDTECGILKINAPALWGSRADAFAKAGREVHERSHETAKRSSSNGELRWEQKLLSLKGLRKWATFKNTLRCFCVKPLLLNVSFHLWWQYAQKPLLMRIRRDNDTTTETIFATTPHGLSPAHIPQNFGETFKKSHSTWGPTCYHPLEHCPKSKPDGASTSAFGGRNQGVSYGLGLSFTWGCFVFKKMVGAGSLSHAGIPLSHIKSFHVCKWDWSIDESFIVVKEALMETERTAVVGRKLAWKI